MKEYEGFFSAFNASMKANEQEVTNILNANTENIKSEIKKLENQMIDTATKLLTSYEIFLNQAKTRSLEAITQAKESANNEISTNKTQSLEAITQAKTSTNNEISANQTQSVKE
ncbi:hypothetical protein HpCHN51_14340 [Helicobacter pylori]